jgi:cyclopropane fatty-acyl-phospholipid synthase-like methyltransferase
MVDSHQTIYQSIIEAGHLDTSAVYEFEKAGGQKTVCRAGDLLNGVTTFEKQALENLAKNERILDAGAGGGRISFYLQDKGYDVTALEKSESICHILKERGLKQIINESIFNYHPSRRYDAILLIKVYSAFGQNEKDAATLIKFLAENIIEKKGELIIVMANPGKQSVKIKRRFILQDRIGPWFESFLPDRQTLIQLANENSLTLEKSEWSDNQKEYFLILRRMGKSS